MTVKPGEFPPAPFELYPHGRVLDTAKWLEALRRDAAMGEASPRAKWGALQADIKRAEEIWSLENIRRKRSLPSSQNGTPDIDDFF